ncbi:uberolysin/carnocyclin family circular bacteriocin [Solwaraspora sp. WMMD1047]|uniref:uberolysin/carnocyclin family circular bacteriocin n=1 Tax=Solwaraspora sp. WMMD1047 TaxID=3016102 RepID=UPI0024165456|nr:uberolysin/carnocyclin family circular bacteriocin [Solwaraspora sp. WMMD1047]MDG4832690.1 uberolysin/carnocyclin family circular bacteriocin [Solwaraspora sp. WMMD1047]
MDTSLKATRGSGALATAAALGLTGLLFASVSVMYIAGMFGLSTAFASQIVNAVQVGGIALAIVMGLLSGGIAATVIATARWAIARWGSAAAVA